MSDSTDPIDELDAVNAILANIGQAPLEDIADVPNSQDAIDALSRLRLTQREVQETPRPWNVEKDWEFEPDAEGFLVLPDNTIRVEKAVCRNDATVDIQQRGYRLYDRVNHTYVFTNSVFVDLVLYMEWDDIPPVARRYIMVKSARQFAAKKTFSGAITKLDEMDEGTALKNMEEADSSTDKRTQATASPHVARMRRGRH